MDAVTASLIGTGVGIVGTLSATIVGNLFQVRGQHQQWRRDNIRQECRELLGQLSVTLFATIERQRSAVTGDLSPNAEAIIRQHYNAVLDLHRNLGSRILISREIRKARIKDRWAEAATAHLKDNDEKKLTQEYEAIAEEIRKFGVEA